LVEDIAGLIGHLGARRAVIIGHDWGGAVAWHIAAKRPDLCSRVAILNSPHPVMFRRALAKRSQLLRSWYMFFFQLPFLPERLLTRNDAALVARMLKRANPRWSEEELQPYREAMRKPGAASGGLSWYRDIPKTIWKQRTARTSFFPPITVPTLLVWGLADPVLGFDDIVPGTERFVPDFSIETIPGAGHFVQSDAPERVNEALLAFLAKERARRLDLH
jgi:pimeloyl-ACP methyl ester carboxylesterase